LTSEATFTPRFRVDPHHLVHPAHHLDLATCRAMRANDNVIGIKLRVGPEQVEQHRSRLVLADQPTTTTSAPSAAKSAQTFAAPPNTARSASRTSIGASGDNRSTEPDLYLSSISAEQASSRPVHQKRKLPTR